MTLNEAMHFMYHNPCVKIECGPWMYENKWIMWTGERFMLESGEEPDHIWWVEHNELGYDWWLIKE